MAHGGTRPPSATNRRLRWPPATLLSSQPPTAAPQATALPEHRVRSCRSAVEAVPASVTEPETAPDGPRIEPNHGRNRPLTPTYSRASLKCSAAPAAEQDRRSTFGRRDTSALLGASHHVYSRIVCCHKTAANFPHGMFVRGIRDRGSCSQGSASNRSVRPLHCVMHMHTPKLGSGGREKILRRGLEQLRRQRAVVVVVGGEGGGDAIPPIRELV